MHPIEGTLARDGAPALHWHWHPRANARAVLLFVHGYGEHSGRYASVFDALGARGFACLGFDLRGHGRSGGKQGSIRSFNEYLDDVDAALGLLRERAGGTPRFLVGHSLGGLICAALLIERGADVAGTVLSAPALALALPVPGWKRAIGAAAARIAPDLALPSNLDPEMLSRDPLEVEAVRADELSFSFARARWFRECRRAQERVRGAAERLRSPLLVLVGGSDPVVSAAEVRAFFERAGSREKQLCWYEDFLHEPFHEIGKERAIADVAGWLERRLPESAAGRVR